jgi:hypothetical protein
MERFKAGVQYGDWEGTVAADDADFRELRKLLTEKELVEDDEFLVAAKVWIGENQGGKVRPPHVSAFVMKREEHETLRDKIQQSTGALDVRKVDLDLSLDEFLGFFKRLSFVFTRKGLELTGKEYSEREN